MDVMTAKQQVIQAGNRLVETGLIARTWGNVSCRVDEKSFVITPSGKAYDSLTPDDIVQLDLQTLEYTGDVKPSSEKGIHAEVYRARPEINFVIHTHQFGASVISALSGGLPASEATAALGGAVPLASYGLPGTKKLKQGVTAALGQTKGKGIIMAHHGAVCFGTDDADAFEAAMQLEEACKQYLHAQFQKKYGKLPESDKDYVESVVTPFTKCDKTIAKPGIICYNSDSQADRKAFELKGSDGSTHLCSMANAESGEPAAAKLHRAIYAARADISVIRCTADPATVGVSAMGKTVKPQLDDFAQIVGVDMRVASPEDAAACVNALKGRHAVYLAGVGALCCGKNEGDAHAVQMIVEKAGMTKVGSLLCGADNKISSLECRLMRFIYLKKYSKKE